MIKLFSKKCLQTHPPITKTNRFTQRVSNQNYVLFRCSFVTKAKRFFPTVFTRRVSTLNWVLFRCSFAQNYLFERRSKCGLRNNVGSRSRTTRSSTSSTLAFHRWPSSSSAWSTTPDTRGRFYKTVSAELYRKHIIWSHLSL
jgi:hypothetical protein